MPFAALWRVDWSTADKMTDSWEMLLQQPDGKYVMQGWFGQDEARGAAFRQGVRGPRTGTSPAASDGTRCWAASPFPAGSTATAGATCSRSSSGVTPSGARSAISPARRSSIPSTGRKAAPFSTPLEKLTVVDLVRMTLGVGPCQYILDLEGQKRNSRGVATCYARDVINAIYKEGTQLQKRPVIEEQLDAAVAFISNVRERIDLYVKFGHEMTAYLAAAETPRSAPRRVSATNCWRSPGGSTSSSTQNRERIHTPAYARQDAADFRAEAARVHGEGRLSEVRRADGRLHLHRRGAGRAGRLLPDDREDAPAAGGNRHGRRIPSLKDVAGRDSRPHAGDPAEPHALRGPAALSGEG